MNIKKCTKCEKSLENNKNFFYKNKHTLDGLSSWCKDCTNNNKKTPYVLKLKQKPTQDGHKFCSRCKIEKQYNEFKPNLKLKSGLSSWCKTCLTESKRPSNNGLPKKIKDPEPDDGLKSCSKCKERKPKTLEYFHKHNQYKAGLNSICKFCCNQKHALYKSQLTKEKKLQYKERRKEYILRNIDKIRAKVKHRMATDPSFRARKSVSNWMGHFIKGKYKNSRSLGCTYKTFKSHIESLFQPGMTWDNYGLYGWHIDHVESLALAYLKGKEAYRAAKHYTNLQPIWKDDHYKKTAQDRKAIKEYREYLKALRR